MKKLLFALALALAVGGLFLAEVRSATATELQTDSQAIGATAINIPRIKSILKLTPAQQPYWPAVEAALLDIAQQQALDDPSAGFIRRVSRRVVTIVLNSAAVRRLAGSALPLIHTLSDEQKRDVRALAQEMGLGPVIAALN